MTAGMMVSHGLFEPQSSSSSFVTDCRRCAAEVGCVPQS